jgi:hypothetical protein
MMIVHQRLTFEGIPNQTAIFRLGRQRPLMFTHRVALNRNDRKEKKYQESAIKSLDEEL